MILGSFSFSSPDVSLVSIVRERLVSEGLEYHAFDFSNFCGGFFLNSYLPYRPEDFTYADTENDIFVLMAGTVYNMEELRQSYGLSAISGTPELIANLYLKESISFAGRCNGDFAGFICRPCKGEAVLFRDQIGICPLAWITIHDSLIFSSDTVGLCKAVSGGQPIDPDYFLGYFKYTDGRKASDKRVQKLLPGQIIEYSLKGTVSHTFWHPEKIKTDRTLTLGKVISDLELILRDAVGIRSDSRFVAGAHLSGGIDSGLVSVLARKEYAEQKDFYGYSWSPGNYQPKEAKFDERKTVEEICARADIRLSEAEIDKEKLLKSACDYFRNQGYFLEDITIEKAVSSGTQMIFSGWGGDEFLSFGERGIDTDLLRNFCLPVFFRRNRLDKPRRFLRQLLKSVILPATGILTRSERNSMRTETQFIKEPYKRQFRPSIRRFFYFRSRRQLHLGLLDLYHIQERCESWWVNGYLKGIVYRFPLLDRRIIEYMLKVPSVMLTKTGGCRGLPVLIGEGLMPPGISFNMGKTDPVSWEFMRSIYKASARDLGNEILEWRNNPDMNFLDFEKLKHYLDKYSGTGTQSGQPELFWQFLYFKGLHEFSRVYRNGLSQE